MFSYLTRLLFPPKCKFCQKILSSTETDLCLPCRTNAPVFGKPKRNFQLIAQWTAVWYYRDGVRNSIRRFKFHNARSYANFYAKMIALRLKSQPFNGAVDVITWVPVSKRRRLHRGYDQAQLLAKALAKELDIPAVRGLKKIRHTRAQSGIKEASARRANVFNSYKGINSSDLADKRVLLVDDIITTGATASECAKMLHVSGATHIYLAAIAAASNEKDKQVIHNAF